LPDMQPPTRSDALEYGKPVPVYRRRWVHLWLIGGAIGLVLGVALVKSPSFIRRVRLIYLQRQCLAYEVSSESPVNGTGKPDCFARFATAVGALPGGVGDVAFLHRMESDEPLLVCISIDPSVPSTSSVTGQTKQLWLSWRTFHLVSLTDSDTPRFSSSQFSAFTGLPAEATVFGGKIDPDDPKHLTIEYEGNGKKGIIDGWLLTESLRIQMREPPDLFRNAGG